MSTRRTFEDGSISDTMPSVSRRVRSLSHIANLRVSACQWSGFITSILQDGPWEWPVFHYATPRGLSCLPGFLILRNIGPGHFDFKASQCKFLRFSGRVIEDDAPLCACVHHNTASFCPCCSERQVPVRVEDTNFNFPLRPAIGPFFRRSQAPWDHHARLVFLHQTSPPYISSIEG